MRKILLLISFFLSLRTFGQHSKAENKAEIRQPEIPLLIYGSLFYSQFKRKGQQAANPEPGWDAGIGMEFPAGNHNGIRCFGEIQRRNYSLDKRTEGTNNAGKRFINTVEGRNETFLMQFPAFYRISLDKDNKFSLLPGASFGIRLKTSQRFSFRYEIPSDSILITGVEDSGTDALDFAEFNAMLGIGYRPLKKLELSLLISHKLFGISIAKENFFSQSEQNTMLILRASWQLVNFGKAPVF